MPFTNLIGNSGEFANILRTAGLIAMTDVTVLISGESGTGKELLARAIHQSSQRAKKPFITVNCAALPEQLVESSLFGHRRGAFTGATTDQHGYVQAAQGGTLFLDEIGELPLEAQAKLLRFLESGECQTVGKTQADQVDVRVLAATNRCLLTASEQGQFRQDLYYRLSIVPLELPALRQRRSDIVSLLKHFTEQLADKHRLDQPAYSKETLAILKKHCWQGNVRELRNFCERMVIFHAGKTVLPSHLPTEFRQSQQSTNTAFVLPEQGVQLDQLEHSLIQQALDKTDGNRSQAARLLGLTRDTLLYRMKKYAVG